eukprot:m.58573 g.58573  ORF g.58573 m.58573 type:complete len:444 (-) comp13774_c0_seq2:87-1418(-)
MHLSSFSAMALSWLCREPSKATALINFATNSVGLAAANSPTKEKLRELTQQRGELLELMAQFRSSSDEVRESFNKYTTNLKGFKKAIDEGAQKAAGEEGAVPESRKLTHATTFKWSDNVSLNIECENNVDFELDNITLNMGIWLMKHAAWVVEYADNSADGDAAAKDIFASLKEAAGIFQYFLQRNRSEIAYAPNTDFDERILEVRMHQCLAEAQEVTLDRARQLKHAPALISAVARDLYDKFQAAADALTSMEVKMAKRLRLYLAFKAKFYQAFMYTYAGLDAFANEKCGDALAFYNASKAALAAAKELGQAYTRAPGSMSGGIHTTHLLSPAGHFLFGVLERTTNEAHDKAHRENGFIYFHKIPAGPPEAPEPKNLTEPKPFEEPTAAEGWEVTTWDASKVPVSAKTAPRKGREDHEDVKFSPFDPEQKRKPTSASGCSIS